MKMTWPAATSFNVSTAPLGHRTSIVLHFRRFAEAEMDAQVVLRVVAAAAANLVDLRLLLGDTP